jgi:hypothetical protein
MRIILLFAALCGAVLAPPRTFAQLWTIPPCVQVGRDTNDCRSADETNQVMYMIEYPANSGCYFSVALRTYNCIPNVQTNGYYFDRVCLIIRCDSNSSVCGTLNVDSLVEDLREEILERDPLGLKRISDTVRVSTPSCWRSELVSGCYEGRTCVNALPCCCTIFQYESYGNWNWGSVRYPWCSTDPQPDPRCPSNIPYPPCDKDVCN